MKRDILLERINPYIRYVQHITGDKNNFFVPWRIIYDFEFVFITEGSFLIKTSYKDYLLHPGDFVCIPPFFRHKQEIPEKCSYYSCHFDFCDIPMNFSIEEIYCKPCNDRLENMEVSSQLLTRDIVAPHQFSRFTVHSLNNAGYIAFLFANLYQIFKDDGDLKPLLLKASFIPLVIAVDKEMNDSIKPRDYNETVVENFKHYVLKNIHKKIDFKEAIKSSGLSENYFRKVFKDNTGVSTSYFIISVKLKTAKSLLLKNQYTVEKVGQMVGFDDVHYFTRLFTNKVGVSPTRYIEENSKIKKSNKEN